MYNIYIRVLGDSCRAKTGGKEPHGSMRGEMMAKEISEERKVILEKLYHSFEIISENAYVYLCDMKYDYSI